jgi:hypothetical protein
MEMLRDNLKLKGAEVEDLHCEIRVIKIKNKKNYTKIFCYIKQ